MSVLKNKIGHQYVVISTFISMGIIILMLVVLLWHSWEAISVKGWQLFSLKWNPPKQEFGILPMLYGTIVVTCIALVLAVPLGVLTAIFTSEILPSRYRFFVKSILELLAGIPSIIYGLIGVSFFSIWIQNIVGLSSGRTILTAGILLAIMVLPTIITLVDDALHQIPQKYRESAKGLGLYPNEIIKSVLVPLTKPQIFSAIWLALGRAMGETMAVMLVIGSIDKIPDPFFKITSPGQTITSKLGREVAESSFGSTHFSVLIFMGVILLIIVVLLMLLAQRKYKPVDRLYE